MKSAIQLYTLREECRVDFLGTLEKVALMGYDGVEFAGFYGVNAIVLKEKLKELNLEPLSAHVSLLELENNLEDVMIYHHFIGNKRIVCPFSNWETDEEFYQLCERLKLIAQTLKQHGFDFCYHNHNHEFKRIKDQYALDYMFDVIGENFLMELDTYWVSVANVDVIKYMEQHKDRLSLIHIKDLKNIDGKPFPVALGTGELPLKAFIQKAENLGLSWIIVENDFPVEGGISDVQKSITYLKNEQLIG